MAQPKLTALDLVPSTRGSRITSRASSRTSDLPRTSAPDRETCLYNRPDYNQRSHQGRSRTQRNRHHHNRPNKRRDSISPAPARARTAANPTWRVVPREGVALRKYKLIKQIGRGSQATVWKACHIETKEVYAIKWARGTIKRASTLKREATLMQSLRHPNIVQFCCAFSPDLGPLSHCAVLEYVEMGSLKSLVQKVGGLTEHRMAPMVQGILSGLAHIHDLGIIHLDIKAENVLITNDCVVKLTDFGVAIREEDAAHQDPAGSTIEFAAPEIVGHSVLGDKRWTTRASTASDIWSVGATAIELFTGEAPSEDLIEQVLRKQKISGASPAFRRFLYYRCLVIEPSKRSTARKLLEHQWIRRNATASDETIEQMIKGLRSDDSDSSDRSAEIIDQEPVQTEDEEKKEARQSPSPSYVAHAHVVDDQLTSSSDGPIVNAQHKRPEPDFEKESAKKPPIRQSSSDRHSSKARKHAGTRASQAQTTGRSRQSYHSQETMTLDEMDEAMEQMFKILNSAGIVDEEPAQTEEEEKKEARQSPTYAASEAPMAAVMSVTRLVAPGADERQTGSSGSVVVRRKRLKPIEQLDSEEKDSAPKPPTRQSVRGARRSYHRRLSSKDLDERLRATTKGFGKKLDVFEVSGWRQSQKLTRRVLNAVPLLWFQTKGWSDKQVRQLYKAGQIELSQHRERQMEQVFGSRRSSQRRRHKKKLSWQRKEKGRK